MGTLVQDLRYAARTLRRSPGFALVAVLTLGLGIGASSALFSVVYGVLLRSLPFEEPERLVRVGTSYRGETEPDLSPANYFSLLEESRSFTQIVLYDPETPTLTGSGEPQTLESAEVSAGFFEVLGVQPALGRSFRPEENEPGNHRVVVLGHATWQRLFGGDPGVLGETVTLDGIPRVVVGVMPPGFGYPESRALWTPLPYTDDYSIDNLGSRGGTWDPALARLRPGVSLEEAQAELQAISRRLAREYPSTNTGVTFVAIPLRDEIVGDIRTPLLLLLGAVGLVLLIACANVAGLLLARASARRGELAVRTALGAGRARLVGQLLTESLVLGVLGGGLGLLLAVWGTSGLVAARPEGIPRVDEIRVDGAVLAFTLGITLLASVLVGIAPAIRATRGALSGVLREGGRSGAGSREGNRFRGGLVVAELALAVVLLTGAGLLLRSFLGLINVDPGFRTERVIAFPLTLPRASYDSDAKIRAFYDRLLDGIRGLPGVESAGAVYRLPLASPGSGNTFRIEGRPPPAPGEKEYMEVRPASPEYFRTLGVPVLRGRAIEPGDREESVPVVVLNEAAAARHFPGEDPLGRRIDFNWSRLGGPRTVVGVVGNVRHFGLADDAAPEAYFPLAQTPVGAMNVVVRTTGDPLALAGAVRREVHAVDANLPVPEFRTMEQVVSASVARPRFLAVLLSLFAGVALALAAVGIFGLLSYAVAQRTREIGIRLALGAEPGAVVGTVLGRALALIAAGLGLGIAGALALTRLLRGVLFGVSPTDPVTLAGVVLLLGATGLLAGLVPARRAARVEPVVALRHE